MNRLQKKCLIGSAGLHGLLGLTLVVTSAFQEKPEKRETITLLTMIPGKAIDVANAVGGGTPPPIAAMPKEQKPPETTPAPPPVEIRKPEPLKPPVEKPPERELAPPKDKTLPPPKEVKKDITEPKENLLTKMVDRAKPNKTATNTAKVDLSKPVKRPPNLKPDNKVQELAAQIEAKRQAQRTAALFAKAMQDIREKGAGATVVDTPGQGGGGEAYADYKSIIYTIYYNAWHPPDLATDDDSTTQAKIVISRSGDILSFRIEKKSGNAALDKSVEAALRRVEKIPVTFPETSKDSQRSFIINFNLKAKNQLG